MRVPRGLIWAIQPSLGTSTHPDPSDLRSNHRERTGSRGGLRLRRWRMGGGALNLRAERDVRVQEARSLRGRGWVRAFGDQGPAGSHTQGLLHRIQEGGWSALETREP